MMAYHRATMAVAVVPVALTWLAAIDNSVPAGVQGQAGLAEGEEDRLRAAAFSQPRIGKRGMLQLLRCREKGNASVGHTPHRVTHGRAALL